MTAPRIIVTGVSWWNRATLSALLAADGASADHRETFAEALEAARVGGAVLYAWASKVTAEDEAAARAAGVPLTFVEDGFIRSVGLGAGLARGGSFVLDRTGIYYDATRASEIETMLETAAVGADEIARAAALRSLIVAARVSKYNVGRRVAGLALPHDGREFVLVVGQVAVDAGVRRTLSATLDVTRADTVNADLLAAARAEFPDAFVVYKPHPDVAGGLRPGAVPAEIAARHADRVVAGADIVDLIEACDRVVTLSSLSGFEALLRGKRVTVHGLPFYAGWGLTDDTTVSPRRTRRRSLDELTAIALLRYCRTVVSTPEQNCIGGPEE